MLSLATNASTPPLAYPSPARACPLLPPLTSTQLHNHSLPLSLSPSTTHTHTHPGPTTPTNPHPSTSLQQCLMFNAHTQHALFDSHTNNTVNTVIRNTVNRPLCINHPPSQHVAGELSGLLLALQSKLGALAHTVGLPRPRCSVGVSECMCNKSGRKSERVSECRASEQTCMGAFMHQTQQMSHTAPQLTINQQTSPNTPTPN